MSLHPQLDDLLELRHQAHALGVAASHLVNSTFTGLYSSVFRGTGLDFDEVREYREGDNIRNMDWLVTAHTDARSVLTDTRFSAVPPRKDRQAARAGLEDHMLNSDGARHARLRRGGSPSGRG